MFFSLSKKFETNFSNFFSIGDFCLSTDAGWQQIQQGPKNVIFKGYADVAPITDLLDQILNQQEPELLGNFCAIVFDKNTNKIKIQTDRFRSFPIYFTDQKAVTNLIKQEHTAWSDSLLEIDQNFTIKETKFDVVGTIVPDELSENQVIDQINKILDVKTTNFLSHNQLPIRAYLSGGVDSLLVYSYLKKFNNSHELINYSHIDYDEFWLKNSGTLGEFWGYSQIHHWKDPCILTSGAPGDEFMLRSPTTSDLYLKSNNTHMSDLLEMPEWQNSLHYSYFKKSTHQNIFQNQKIDLSKNRKEHMWELCNIVVNDWQHWHLGNTLTWTPLRDLEIFKLLLRLPLDSAIEQILDSKISRRLIEANQPGLSLAISDQKNSGNVYKNLCGILL
jgi:hypothetical protein